MTNKAVNEFIYDKFFQTVTQKELETLSPVSVDWVGRTKKTIDEFLPIAKDLAIFIHQNVPRKLNSPFKLQDLFNEKKEILNQDKNLSKWLQSFEENIVNAVDIIGALESQQVSAEIQRQVTNWSKFQSKIYANGNSIYPDFIFKDRDYDPLPTQKRGKNTTVHGPCLRGKNSPRPSNVPDGIELKTNQGSRVRVDAHAPHIGLHLAFTWHFDDEKQVCINGAWLAFINESDHKEATRNSKTTTVKYSFGQDKFISLLK